MSHLIISQTMPDAAAAINDPDFSCFGEQSLVEELALDFSIAPPT